MKYAVNQIALLKNGIIGTICKTELLDGKGYYTLSLGNDQTTTVRTGDIKTIVGNVLSEIPGRSQKELLKYFDGKKVNIKELKKFYVLLAKSKIVDDIVNVDTNINASDGLSFEEFSNWFNNGRIKERSNISMNPYIGYITVNVDEKINISMLVANMDENAIYPLFYKVNDMPLITGPCVIDISQQWKITPMEERQARSFRNTISSYSDMIYLNEHKCFIRKSVLPKKGDVVKMKNYNPDTLPGYLNAVNLFFSGKDIIIKCISPDGSILFNPSDKSLKKQDYYCLVSDIDNTNITENSIKEPQTKRI